MAKKKTKKGTKTPKKTPPPKKKNILFTITKWLFIFGVWGVLLVGGVVLWYAKDLPDITQSATFERKTSIIVKAEDGTVLARYGEQKSKNIHVDDLPPHLIQAVLAIEDRRFYNHHGIDLWGISRAMIANLRAGRFVQGGSTITQQLAKNLFLTHERKLPRKIKEAILAIWIERELSKDEILSAYMNRVYLGSGTYGFNTASNLYFGKPARQVNLHEAAILAGLLKAPSKYSPHASLDRAKERAKIVLNAMIDAGYITQKDMSAPNMAVSLPHKITDSAENARYFTDWVLDGIDDLVGRPDMDMVIETTLDTTLQNYTQDKIARAIKNADPMQFVGQGAALVMRPDGRILSMVGGYDYGKSQFNRVTQSRRAPGSTLKPFVYLAALEQGWSADDVILDAPILKGEYRPQNALGRYYGEVSLRQALAKSMNTATVRLAQKIGISHVLNTVKQAGILSKMERDLSLALGSSGVSILELTTAYATLSNGGQRVYPYAITKITTPQGRVLYERTPPRSYSRVFQTRNTETLSIMMQDVINRGTGRRAQLPFTVSGKTGTSQDSRDAWFAGYSDRLVSVVWLGNDDNAPMRGVSGGGIPAQIWRDVIAKAQPRYRKPSMRISGHSRHPSQESGSMSSLLGRLLSHDNSSAPTPPRNIQRKNDYSNFND